MTAYSHRSPIVHKKSIIQATCLYVIPTQSMYKMHECCHIHDVNFILYTPALKCYYSMLCDASGTTTLCQSFRFSHWNITCHIGAGFAVKKTTLMHELLPHCSTGGLRGSPSLPFLRDSRLKPVTVPSMSLTHWRFIRQCFTVRHYFKS